MSAQKVVKSLTPVLIIVGALVVFEWLGRDLVSKLPKISKK